MADKEKDKFKGLRYTGIAGDDRGHGKTYDTYREEKGQRREWWLNKRTGDLRLAEDEKPRAIDPAYEVRGQRGYKAGGLVKRGYGKARSK